MAKSLGLKGWDDRADKLSETALDCRVEGHRWLKAAQSPTELRKLASQGLEEISEYCPVCGGTKFKCVNVRDGSEVEAGRTYGDDYNVEKGSGRLRRQDARVARFARMHPTLV